MPNDQCPSNDQGPTPKASPPDTMGGRAARARPVYDLEERTAKFAEAVIGLAARIQRTPVTTRVIEQFVGSGTSIGANYCEAEDSISRKEFRKNVGICRKEAKETKYWLRVIATAAPELREDARSLWKEANELHLIFCKTMQTLEAEGGS